MKHLLIAIFFFVASSVACAQSEETRNLPSFNKVSVSESIKLIIKEGNSNSARVEASGVDVEKVLTEISGSSLNVHMARGNYRSISVTVYLTYSDKLNEVKASSSSSVFGKSMINTDEFYAKVSSSAKMELEVNAEEVEIDVSSSGKGDLVVNAQELDIEISSSGRLELSGKAAFQKFDISSSGKLMAYDLRSERVRADISSSGRAEISVSEEIIADASSSGRITYKGSPEKVLVDTSSSGSVKKVN
ncbi:MAG: DUF2807 domain-containing protein [Cyclobacteriaceae bacterium]